MSKQSGYPPPGYPPPDYPPQGYPPPGYPPPGYPPTGYPGSPGAGYGYPQGAAPYGPPPPAGTSTSYMESQYQPGPQFRESGKARDGYSTYNYVTPEDAEVPEMGFSNRNVRRNFIKKVYIIVTAQLLVTCAMTALFLFSYPIKSYVNKNSWLFHVGYITFIVVYLGLICCCSELRRKVPENYILLGIITLSMGLMTAVISSKYDTDIVLIAMGMTALVTFLLTLFAIQTKIDFTQCTGLMLVLILVLLVFGIVTMIANLAFGYNKILNLVYACLGTLVFSVFIVVDTQRIIGGTDRAEPLDEEEYIFAALELYIDIIQLFWFILRIVNFSNDNNSNSAKNKGQKL